MVEIMIDKKIGIPGNIPDELINEQIEEAIKYIAYIQNKNTDEIMSDIDKGEVITENWDEGYAGIYVKLYFKTGEKCTMPLAYIFENEIKVASWAHMFSDGECEF
jgi:hypothetical protein